MEIINGVTFQDVATVVATVIGAASLMVKAFDLIAGITPSTADDRMVGRIRRVLGKVTKLADRLALNPDTTKARKGG